MRFAILAALGLLVACGPQPAPVLDVEDGGNPEKPEPKGVLFKDPATGTDVFINPGDGLFF